MSSPTGRLRASVLVAALVGTLLVPVAGAQAATTRATALLAQLVVAAEVDSPAYDRSFFTHWVDADRDGCNTRAEVLKRSSTAAVTYSSGCTVATGRWTSTYDATTWTSASDVDIDHLVPLHEAWQSGAHRWTAAQRQAFANDLEHEPALVVMTSALNRSKGSRDPAEWLPPAAQCTYLVAWASVKYRWSLTIDSREARVLGDRLGGDCGNPALTLPGKAGVAATVAATTSPFTDVAISHPFLAEITWLSQSGVTTGYPDGRFKPSANISREAFAAFLYRYSHGGGQPAACTRQWFTDVPVSSPFCGHIQWLAGTGLTTGYADGSFRPGSQISREAVAAMLQRYRASAGPVTTSCNRSLYRDAAASPFCAEITWLAATGITTGYPDGTFRPGRKVTREAIGAYFYRYDQAFGPSKPPIVVSPPAPKPSPAPTPNPAPKPPPANPGDTKNCSDFRTWAEAQAWFDLYFPHYGDVARLDADGDGIACESLPGAP